jgi:hypothetical protein
MQQFPQPPAQKSGSGKTILIVVALLVVGGGVVLALVAGVGGYLYYTARQTQGTIGAEPVSADSPSGTSSSSSSSATAERPSPTPAQLATLEGGQEMVWSETGITWTVPATWTKNTADKTTFLARSPGSWEAASLIASISPMSSDFPTDMSLDAYHKQAMEKLGRGEVTEVKWLEIDGVRGVMWHEARPDDAEDPQRIQWIGFRSYLGQTQMVNIMLASRGKDLPQHEDAMYAVLYSTKLS